MHYFCLIVEEVVTDRLLQFSNFSHRYPHFRKCIHWCVHTKPLRTHTCRCPWNVNSFATKIMVFQWAIFIC